MKEYVATLSVYAGVITECKQIGFGNNPVWEIICGRNAFRLPQEQFIGDAVVGSVLIAHARQAAGVVPSGYTIVPERIFREYFSRFIVPTPEQVRRPRVTITPPTP